MRSFFEVIAGIVGVFSITIYIIGCIAVYLVSSYGLYRAAINNQVKNPWIAFVPVLQSVIPGSLTEEYIFRGYKIPNLKIILPLIVLIRIIVSPLWRLPYRLLKLLTSVIIALILHKFFYLYKPQKALIYAVLCFIFGEVAFAVLMILLRDDSMIMSPGAYQYPFK